MFAKITEDCAPNGTTIKRFYDTETQIGLLAEFVTGPLVVAFSGRSPFTYDGVNALSNLRLILRKELQSPAMICNGDKILRIEDAVIFNVMPVDVVAFKKDCLATKLCNVVVNVLKLPEGLSWHE